MLLSQVIKILSSTGGSEIQETIKCKAEIRSPDLDWERIWLRSRMKGLLNDSRSLYWRMFHALLPTQKNLNKTNRRVEHPNCVLCDANVPDDIINHCFTAYSQSTLSLPFIPSGLLEWANEPDIGESHLNVACMFANKCTKDVFSQTFQFKINCKILPTNYYLHQYKVLDSNKCAICDNIDTVLHRTWECREVLNFVECMFTFLNEECDTSLSLEESRNDYLFGLEGEKFCALNQILLELKIFNFYNLPKDVNQGINVRKIKFLCRIRKLMAKEKYINVLNCVYENFVSKISASLPLILLIFSPRLP